MIPKPPACLGCPAYDQGSYWVPDLLTEGSEVTLLLPSPSEEDIQGQRVVQRVGKGQYLYETVPPQPLLGVTGYDCRTQWFHHLHQVGDLSLVSTIRCRSNHDKPSSRDLLDLAVRCSSTHGRLHQSTRLIVACGPLPAKSKGCPEPFTAWRGHIIPESNPPVLVIDHTSEVYKNPKSAIPMIKDWGKIDRFLKGEWPLPLPPIQYFRNSGEDHAWFTQASQQPFVSLDTEYTVGSAGDTPKLTLVGLSYPGNHKTLSVWWSGDVIPYVIPWLKWLVGQVPIVMWNAVADIPVLEAATGIGYQDYLRVDDPMLKHALLWSELPHTLEYCASLDGQYPKLKHLMAEDLALYNQGDVLETTHLNHVYDTELEGDPPTRHVYETQSLPLIPVILRSQSHGIRVHREKVVETLHQYRLLLDRAVDLARQATGTDINLGSSKQIQTYLYTHKGYQVQKHFKTKRPTVDAHAINTLRSTYLPVDAEYEEKEGVTYEDILERIGSGADPFLESCALFSSGRNVLSTYLLGLVSAVYRENHARRKKAARDHVRGSLDHLSVDDIIDRVYPQYKQHTQANGRWSITDPPMAGMPKLLHHLFIPDPGHCWIKYDFKQIEPRIRACISTDKPRLRDFATGKDIYQSTCLEMFGRYTPTLRKLGKTVELALSYGKQPHNMHHVPGIMGYGFKKEDLKRAGENYLRAHPEQTRWMGSHIQSLHGTGFSREPIGGRRRNLLGHWSDQEREGLNQPMQGGATSLTNLTILKIVRACPSIWMVNNRFDEHWWSVPVGDLDVVRQTMISILAEPWVINGITMVFPVDPPELTVIYPPEDL